MFLRAASFSLSSLRGRLSYAPRSISLSIYSTRNAPCSSFSSLFQRSRPLGCASCPYSNFAKDDGTVAVDADRLIRAYSRGQDPNKAVSLLRDIRSSGVRPALHMYNSALFAAVRMKDLKCGLSVMDWMEADKLALDKESYTHLLRLCVIQGRASLAWNLFEQAKALGIPMHATIYNLLLRALISSSRGTEHLELVENVVLEMEKAGVLPNQRTFHLRMEAAGRLGDSSRMFECWDIMANAGFASNEVTYGLLLNSQAKQRNVAGALSIFDSMLSQGILPNTVHYTSMVEAYLRSKEFPSAVQMFQRMIDGGCIPSTITYGLLIYSAWQRVDDTYIQHFFNHMMKERVKPSSFTYRIMLSHAFRSRNYDLAASVLTSMQESKCALDPLHLKSIVSSKDVQDICLPENVGTLLVDVLSLPEGKILVDSRRIVAGFHEILSLIEPSSQVSVACSMIECASHLEVPLPNNFWVSLIGNYPRELQSSDISKLMHRIWVSYHENWREHMKVIGDELIRRGKGVVLPPLLYRGSSSELSNVDVEEIKAHLAMECVHTHDHKKALELIEDLIEAEKSSSKLKEGSVSTQWLNDVLENCASQMKVSAAVGILKLMEKHGSNSLADEDTYDSVLRAHVRSGNLSGAVSFLEEMKLAGYPPKRNAFVQVLRGCTTSGDFGLACDVVHRMCSANSPPEERLITAMISRCSNAQDVTLAFKLVDDLLISGASLTIQSFNALINACVSAGQVQRGLEVFSKLETHRLLPDVVTYNALIRGCGRLLDLDRALSYFKEMQASGIQPDKVTYGSLIDACGRCGSLEKAKYFLMHMIECNLTPDDIIYRNLLHASSKNGDLTMVLDTFALMKQAKMQISNSMYRMTYLSFLRNGYSNQSLELEEVLHRNGIRFAAGDDSEMLSEAVRKG